MSTEVRLTSPQELTLRSIGRGDVYRDRFAPGGRCYDRSRQLRPVAAQVRVLMDRDLAAFDWEGQRGWKIPVALTDAGRAWLDGHPEKET